MRTFATAVLIVAIRVPCIADDSGGDADPIVQTAKSLADRLARLLPDGWQATVNERSEVVVERHEPVGFVANHPGMPPVSSQVEADAQLRETLETLNYRITLRLAPRLTLERYDQLAAENAKRAEQRDALFAGVSDIPNKGPGGLAPGTPEEKRRVAEFARAYAKLKDVELPQFHTATHAVYAYQSWHPWQFAYDETVRTECAAVVSSLERYLGMYSPEQARGRVEFHWRPREQVDE